MGRAARLRPARLAEKLKQIREKLDLSQGELVIRLGLHGSSIHRNRISDYELGINEPPLPILLRYARLANVIVDVLIDDQIDLPEQIPYQGRKPKI
jgi:transcriptional regulator with XRE-family HTH domain